MQKSVKCLLILWFEILPALSSTVVFWLGSLMHLLFSAMQLGSSALAGGFDSSRRILQASPCSFSYIYLARLWSDNLIFISGQHCDFKPGSWKKSTLLWFMSERVLPLFSSRSFIVSGFMFRTLIHFEFSFVYDVRKYVYDVLVSFFCKWLTCFPSTTC